MHVNNSQPSFGSTMLKLTPDTPVMNKYLDKISQYFELKGFAGDKLIMKPQLAADQIDFSQAAVIPKGNDTLLIVGKDGGDGGADTFIARILKETFPNDKAIVYTDDIAPVKVDGPVIDMTEIGKIIDSEV